MSQHNFRVWHFILALAGGSSSLFAACPGTYQNQFAPFPNPDAPLVSLQTRNVANQGNEVSDYSVTVGQYTYTAQPTGDGSLSGMQIVYLDRQSLECLSNFSISANQYEEYDNVAFRVSDPGCDANTRSNGCLVIIQSLQTMGAINAPPFNGTYYTFGLTLANQFGANSAAFSQFNEPSSAAYSLVGEYINGFGQNPYERLTCSSGCTDIPIAGSPGTISGALMLDNHNAFTFTYLGRASFDTGTNPQSQRNVITIGRNYGENTTRGVYRSDPSFRGGFQILVLYRDCLCVVSNETLWPEETTFVHHLQQIAANRNQIAIISGFGNLDHSQAAWDAPAKAIVQLGGTYDTFQRLKSGDVYALVGWGGATNAAQGAEGAIEKSSQMVRQTSVAGAPVAIRGTLKRDRTGYYAPARAELSTASDGTANALDSIAFQTPVAFPTIDPFVLQKLSTCAAGAAVNDIRSQYGKTNIDPNQWGQNLDSSCSKDSVHPDPVYDSAWNQLHQEFQDLSYIKQFRQSTETFTNALQSIPNSVLGQAYNDIVNSINPGGSQGVSPYLTDILGAVGSVGVAAIGVANPIAGVAADLVVSGGVAALELSTDSQGYSFEAIQTTLAQLQDDTANAFTQSFSTLGRLFDLTQVDWGRMQRLSNQLAASQIYSSTSSFDNAKNALGISLRREFYAALLRSTYSLAHWTEVSAPGDLATVCGQFTIDYHGYCPTDDGPDPANYVSLLSSVQPDGTQVYEVYKIGYDVAHAAYWASADSFLDNFFQPVNSNSSQQLGIYQPYFYQFVLQRSPSISVCLNASNLYRSDDVPQNCASSQSARSSQNSKPK